MALERITNHAARAIARLAQQFALSARLRGMVSALATEVQAAEDALFDTLEAIRNVDVATGQTLDNLAELVGAPVRGARNDFQFRARIKTQILVNRSSGAARDIYGIARALVSAWAIADQPRITDAPPAAYELACDPRGSVVNDTDEAIELARVLREANSAGVRGIVLSQGQDASVSFSFANGPGLGFGAGALTGAYDGKQ